MEEYEKMVLNTKEKNKKYNYEFDDYEYVEDSDYEEEDEEDWDSEEEPVIDIHEDMYS